MTHTMYEESSTDGTPVLSGPRVVLRPIVSGEHALLATRIASDAEASPWWGTDAGKIEGWLADPESTVYVIVEGDDDIGIIQYEEETDPDYRHAGIDISVFEAYLGKGYGTEALRVLATYLIGERGHHRLLIDPAASNARAIHAYGKVGFKPVGIMRAYERGPDGDWHDGLLMDLLAEELTEHPAYT